MARTRNEDILAKYAAELKRSQRWRGDDDYDSLWRRLVDLYRGKHYAHESKKNRAVVNMAFATKNVIAPSVAVNNPYFTCNPRREDAAPQAEFAEEVVNYDWRTYRFQQEIRRAVDDWLIVGHGWIKCGYKFTKPPEVKKALDRPAVEDGEDEGVDDRVDVDGNTETEMRTTQNRPYIERVSPHDIFVDPDATTPETMRWIAQRVRRPVVDVRVDGRYDPKIRKEVEGSVASSLDEPDHPKNQTNTASAESAKANYVDVWEYYDLQKRVVCVFADSCNKGFLIAPKPIPYEFGHPFLMLRNYDVPDFFYPMGELEAIEELQYELNEIRTSIMQQRRKYARKYIYEEDAFDNSGLGKLESDEDGVMVPVRNGKPLNEAIKALDTMITPGDFFNGVTQVADDIRSVTAVSDYMSGQLPEIRRTATEAALIQDASNARAADKLARLELFLAACAERVIQLRQQFMTGEEEIRSPGASLPHNPVFLRIDRDFIMGEFDFEVEAGSTQPRNETFRRQSAMQLMDAIAAVGPDFINMPALLAKVLKDGFGIKDPTKYIVDPQEQAMVQQVMGQAPQGPQVPQQGFSQQPGPPPMDPSMLAGAMA